MKVTVEYSDAFEARLALQANAYLEFVEEFERYLTTAPGGISRPEILDKFAALRDLYKV
jgi:hypothetical protein